MKRHKPLHQVGLYPRQVGGLRNPINVEEEVTAAASPTSQFVLVVDVDDETHYVRPRSLMPSHDSNAKRRRDAVLEDAGSGSCVDISMDVAGVDPRRGAVAPQQQHPHIITSAESTTAGCRDSSSTTVPAIEATQQTPSSLSLPSDTEVTLDSLSASLSRLPAEGSCGDASHPLERPYHGSSPLPGLQPLEQTDHKALPPLSPKPGGLPANVPATADMSLLHVVVRAICCRKNHNQAVTDQLQHLHDYYRCTVTGGNNGSWTKPKGTTRATAAKRPTDAHDQKARSVFLAMLRLKALPWRLASRADLDQALNHDPLQRLRGIGAGLAAKIGQVLDSGTLDAFAAHCSTPRFVTVQVFRHVWGAGYATASKWYDRGYRSLGAVARDPHLTEQQRIGLQYFDDFCQPMSRAQVEAHGRYIEEALCTIEPEATCMLTGSYRRGQVQCKDVDVIITHPTEGKEEQMLLDLHAKLHASGYLVEDLLPVNATSLRECCGHHPGWCHYKLFAVARLHKSEPARRIDLWVTTRKSFVYSLLYTVGSAYFNRFLRYEAQVRGYHLCNHACTPMDPKTKAIVGQPVSVTSEEELFALLQLPWIPPWWRIEKEWMRDWSHLGDNS